MTFNRDLAWDILAEFNMLVDGELTEVGQIGVDNSAEYEATLDQLAQLGKGFDRDLAESILVEFSMLAESGSTLVGQIGADNTATFDSALDQLAACYK